MVKAAKKRKKEEDEAFSIPEFDEAGYLRKEVESAKVALVGVALAVPVAGLLYVLTVAGVPVVAFFLGLAFAFLLPRIYRVLPWPSVDTAKFERRDWIGHGGTFFMSLLAFWILFLNVPFVDVTSPVITGVRVNDVLVRADVQTDPVPPGTINITALIYENADLRDYRFSVDGADVTPVQSLGRSRYGISVTVSVLGSHPVVITAEDGSGHTAAFGFLLVVGPP